MNNKPYEYFLKYLMHISIKVSAFVHSTGYMSSFFGHYKTLNIFIAQAHIFIDLSFKNLKPLIFL